MKRLMNKNSRCWLEEKILDLFFVKEFDIHRSTYMKSAFIFYDYERFRYKLRAE